MTEKSLRQRRYRWPTALVILLVLVSCVPSANVALGSPRPDGPSAGFLLGLWHGLIAPFTFVVSLFKETIGVYETHNTGWPYNLGFLLGIMSVFGGAGAKARTKK